MSLLLTRDVHEHRIDIGGSLRRALGVHRLHPAILKPFTDEAAVKIITLHDQYTLHKRSSP